MEFLKIIGLGLAQKYLADILPNFRTIKLPLMETINYVLAKDIISPEDMPGFNRSTVDGYAVRASDTFGSSESLPGILFFSEEIMIGKKPCLTLQPGQCAWIPTGGMLPDGADAVIMVEHTEKMGDDTILAYRPVSLGENVMLQGEDVKKEEALFLRGKKIRPQDIGLLASLGIHEVEVYEKLKIGIISSGDEVVPINQVPELGQVRDVNTYSLAAAVTLCNCYPLIYPIVEDEYVALKHALSKVLEENDLVLISGGSSIGTMDLTLKALMSLDDSEIMFHGIAVRPGKPTLLANVASKPVLGLPGHPVSALMVFHILCAPLLRLQEQASFYGRLTLNVASQAGRDDFVPVRLIQDQQQGTLAEPLLGKSGLMNILAQADGYIHITSEKQGVSKGEMVLIKLFDL